VRRCKTYLLTGNVSLLCFSTYHTISHRCETLPPFSAQKQLSTCHTKSAQAKCDDRQPCCCPCYPYINTPTRTYCIRTKTRVSRLEICFPEQRHPLTPVIQSSITTTDTPKPHKSPKHITISSPYLTTDLISPSPSTLQTSQIQPTIKSRNLISWESLQRRKLYASTYMFHLSSRSAPTAHPELLPKRSQTDSEIVLTARISSLVFSLLQDKLTSSCTVQARCYIQRPKAVVLAMTMPFNAFKRLYGILT
jgi:hypothetical protein